MSTPSSVAPPLSLLALKLTDCRKPLDDIAFPGNTRGDSEGVLWMLPERWECEVNYLNKVNPQGPVQGRRKEATCCLT